jgi:hypothetical protein
MSDNTWQSGWLVRDGSNPHSVAIEKVGNPMYVIRNMRWGIDLKVADSHFASNVSDSTKEF